MKTLSPLKTQDSVIILFMKKAPQLSPEFQMLVVISKHYGFGVLESPIFFTEINPCCCCNADAKGCSWACVIPHNPQPTTSQKLIAEEPSGEGFGVFLPWHPSWQLRFLPRGKGCPLSHGGKVMRKKILLEIISFIQKRLFWTTSKRYEKKTIFTTFFSPKIFKTSYKSSTSLRFPQRAHYQLQVVSPSEPTRHPPAPSLPSPIYCYLLYMRRCNLRFAVRGKAFS